MALVIDDEAREAELAICGELPFTTLVSGSKKGAVSVKKRKTITISSDDNDDSDGEKIGKGRIKEDRKIKREDETDSTWRLDVYTRNKMGYQPKGLRLTGYTITTYPRVCAQLDQPESKCLHITAQYRDGMELISKTQPSVSISLLSTEMVWSLYQRHSQVSPYHCSVQRWYGACIKDTAKAFRAVGGYCIGTKLQEMEETEANTQKPLLKGRKYFHSGHVQTMQDQKDNKKAVGGCCIGTEVQKPAAVGGCCIDTAVQIPASDAKPIIHTKGKKRSADEEVLIYLEERETNRPQERDGALRLRSVEAHTQYALREEEKEEKSKESLAAELIMTSFIVHQNMSFFATGISPECLRQAFKDSKIAAGKKRSADEEVLICLEEQETNRP
ncbi:hypothetical protein EGW08_020679 [Elysia chlorotica]|uniref:Uncharacterized protein n=1 Tax=Elysia chlorotica TaxID=188477 RepID=A0A3S0Z860_ELYCH|nr:hypothetical protein EGW08_020679 [Elysia chlorotica]